MSMIINPSRFAVAGGGGGALVRNNAPAAHKAWRLNMKRDVGYTNPREMGLISIDFEDLTTTKGGTPFSSGEFGGGSYPIANVFDRNPGSIASLNPANDPWFMGWIFPTPQPVWMTLSVHADNIPGASFIQYSDDTTNGTDGTWFTPGGGIPDGYRQGGEGMQFLVEPAAFVADGHGPARYYRMVPLRSPNGYMSAEYCRFMESGIDVMGTGTPSGECYNTGYPPSQFFSLANDFGISAPVASPGGVPRQYMQWDFGEGNAFDVDQILFRTRNDFYGTNEAVQKFGIACSNDLATWYWTWYFDVGTPMTGGEIRTFTRP